MAPLLGQRVKKFIPVELDLYLPPSDRRLDPQLNPLSIGKIANALDVTPLDLLPVGDDIWIVDHKTGHLISEYNRFKETDKEAFGEYEGLLEEVMYLFN